MQTSAYNWPTRTSTRVHIRNYNLVRAYYCAMWRNAYKVGFCAASLGQGPAIRTRQTQATANTRTATARSLIQLAEACSRDLSEHCYCAAHTNFMVLDPPAHKRWNQIEMINIAHRRVLRTNDRADSCQNTIRAKGFRKTSGGSTVICTVTDPQPHMGNGLFFTSCDGWGVILRRMGRPVEPHLVPNIDYEITMHVRAA
jgi:hypothetical protein